MPVNPNEQEVLGEQVYASLLDIPEEIHVDVVDVFVRLKEASELRRYAPSISSARQPAEEIDHEVAFQSPDERPEGERWDERPSTPAPA